MKSIIFDVDGTLWDTTEVVAKAWNRSIHESGKTSPNITSSVLKKEFGKTMDVIANNLFPDSSEREREQLLKKCCEYEHDALRENTDNLLFDGVKETIEELSRRCQLFIVSNCQSGYIELFMKKAGIEKCIKDYECFGDTGKSKGENIKLVIERNNLDDVVYVGDTLGDYEASVFAGVPFIFAKYGFGNVPACDFAISSIRQLLTYC
ncbi:HAD family hydrolase [Clostridium sp. YIM B02515]|uniref:HAD family hydrolase n=1 Tax=Clostridium rhizosphaerae TaxID=2803861 RepID=A0ABS1TD68_9CLOT|nr:HAD family hydrolase [Clostridium rhizosphaerae]MBL4936727.1 HAD family hydrolase [Clostridium rhizosphaerae]